MSSFVKKLRLTLAIIGKRFRRRKRRVDFSTPSPHGRKWDEREREMSRRQQFSGPTAGGLNRRVVAALIMLLAASFVADLLLPPIVGTAVGLAMFGVVFAFIFMRQRRQLH